MKKVTNSMNTRSKKTIDKIFDAAMVCLAEKGYAGATMDEIIRTAGVSKGAVYWHFKSKKELFYTLFEKWIEFFVTEFRRISEAEGSAWDRIKLTITYSIEFIGKDAQTSRAYAEFFNIAIKERDFLPAIREIYNQLTGMIAEIVQSGIDNGEFIELEVKPFSDLFVTLLDGMVLRSLIDEEFDLSQATEILAGLLKRALLETEEEQP